MIDITFDFRSDTPKGKDPDTYSPTLNKYHRMLWSKELPNGEVMDLKSGRPPYVLNWKDYYLTSDTIIVEINNSKNQKIIEQVNNLVDDPVTYFENLLRRSYSIGGMILFPCHTNSMNQRRGTHPKIRDRWDLTLECIRRYYSGEESPLTRVIESDKSFYDLFIDFKGYVDFFLLQDCVSEDYSKVDIWCGDASFQKNGLPETVGDYLKFIRKEHEFLDKRNKRIQQYCIENHLLGDDESIDINRLRAFFNKQSWTFAKTYANKAPHEYIVRSKINGTDEEFMRSVIFILHKGFTMHYWNYSNKYFFLDGHQYWVMRDDEDDPTTVINRCNVDEYKYSIMWKGKRQ